MAADDNSIPLRACNKCQVKKLHTVEFFKKVRGKPGPRCKECINTIQQERRLSNPGKEKERRYIYYHRDVDVSREKIRQRRAENPGPHIASSRKWYYNNLEKVRLLLRIRSSNIDPVIANAYQREWRRRNPEKVRRRDREYYKKHKQVHDLKGNKRRA